MTATNHFLTGVVIAATTHNPWLALPVALASHFVLDALPHFGAEWPEQKQLFYRAWLIDAVLLSLTLIVLFFGVPRWYLLAGAVAASPDVVWAYRFVIKQKMGKLKIPRMGTLTALHSDIQHFESPRGAYVELVLGVALAITVYNLL